MFPQEFNYSVDNRPQLNFDGHQGQSHGFVQGSLLDALSSNLSSHNAQGASYPPQNIYGMRFF